MEDLEYNQLHIALLTEFRREFELACRMSYTIAIPHSETLDNFQIDRNFAMAHILIPSKLLKSHFHSMLPSKDFDDIQMVDGRKLICTKSNDEHSKQEQILLVRILNQEIGYNNFNKEYTTFLIDRPLVLCKPQINRVSSKSNDLSSLFGLTSSLASPTGVQAIQRHTIRVTATPNKRQKLDRNPVLKDHGNCLDYLEKISFKTAQDLKQAVERLRTTYFILSDYLDDAADRLNRLVDSYVTKFSEHLEVQDPICMSLSNSISSARYRNIRLAVENYSVHFMHSELMNAIQERYVRRDTILLERLNQIAQSQVSVCHLGAQRYFSNFQANDELCRSLRLMPSLQSPIGVVNELMHSIELINESLNQSVESKRLLCRLNDDDEFCNELSLFYKPFSPRTVSICSDDFIATLVYSLAQARPNNLYSIMKYLELFGWCSTAQDQAAYFTATMQIAIQYVISNPTIETQYCAIDSNASPIATATSATAET